MLLKKTTTRYVLVPKEAKIIKAALYMNQLFFMIKLKMYRTRLKKISQLTMVTKSTQHAPSSKESTEGNHSLISVRQTYPFQKSAISWQLRIYTQVKKRITTLIFYWKIYLSRQNSKSKIKTKTITSLLEILNPPNPFKKLSINVSCATLHAFPYRL